MFGFYSLDWLYVIGTISFTISGYLIGARKRFDLLGIVILSLLTAIGGGVIRDVLVNRIPLVFFDMSAGYSIFGTLAFAWLIKLNRQNTQFLSRLFIVADSIGLVAFSISGAQLGLGMDINLFGVCALAFVTAIGGGLVRDMLVNEVPFILHKDFYGTIPILIAFVLYALDHYGLSSSVGLWVIFWLGLGLRLLAHKQDLQLPKVN